MSYKQEADKLGPWHYSHSLPDGTRTGQSPPDRNEKLELLVSRGVFKRTVYPRVLDLGANSGLISMWFVDNKESTVDAVEFGPKYYPQLEWIIDVKGYSDKITPMREDIHNAQFGSSNYYDLVLFLGVMHHLKPETHYNVLRRCKEVLYPGGQLVVQTRDTIDVPDLLEDLGFQDIYEVLHQPEPHNKTAWTAIKDPMKL